MVKNLPANAGNLRDMGLIPWSGEGNGNHSSILAWRTPWTEEFGGLQSTWSQRVRHDWSDLAQHTCIKQIIRTCYITQGTLLNALSWPKWDTAGTNTTLLSNTPIWKEKRKTFPSCRKPTNKHRRNTDWRNHHLATVMAKTDAGKHSGRWNSGCRLPALEYLHRVWVPPQKVLPITAVGDA